MNLQIARIARKVTIFNRLIHFLSQCFNIKIYIGRRLSSVPRHSFVFFPIYRSTLCCGLAGMIVFKSKDRPDTPDMNQLQELADQIANSGFTFCNENGHAFETHYLGGKETTAILFQKTTALKNHTPFFEIFSSNVLREQILKIAGLFQNTISTENAFLKEHIGRLKPDELQVISRRLEQLRDSHWCLTSELSSNLDKINALMPQAGNSISAQTFSIYKELNAVLNSIDRLEVRGRDSAGISLMFLFETDIYKKFNAALQDAELIEQLERRLKQDVLRNNAIRIGEGIHYDGGTYASVTLTYKVAAEIGRLGDNIRFIREQIKADKVLHTLTAFPFVHHSILSHTRWASVGAITEANCHPVDNVTLEESTQNAYKIHVCLNGDIDNYQELRTALEKSGGLIHDDITTDTKIIPLQISHYIQNNHDVEEAFRLAVNDFKGSHAISMHTDLAPGKQFLALKGSGQALFIGISADHYMPTSEVYGFVEETSRYVKMEGENTVNGRPEGQICILDQRSSGGPDGIKSMFYNGAPIKLCSDDIKQTEITTRDIDRQDFPHYFLKEISESPLSVQKTLQGRWKINADETDLYEVSLDDLVIPEKTRRALAKGVIRRVYFVGQGTAGVAALTCSNILSYYMGDPTFYTNALKASELSGFTLSEKDGKDSLADTLVVAISQSGTTTDTNRTIEMVRERGAHTIAIVNRRDSDITFKVDGVMYTSSGRDIEMSVASTKAFYSQIVAGALLSLFIAQLKNRIDNRFVSNEIHQLLAIPEYMQRVLSLRNDIEASAQKHAVTKTYWAAVGSGSNKAAADEIRIKLSELCYKTISTDYIEDKKHIDLSSEPLIIICAAGTKGHVVGDIIKDTAIFQAHKATPIVIADEGESRFNPYAADVFNVPAVEQHLSPILNTLAGHLWGYYAALAINDGSSFLYRFRDNLRNTIDDYIENGLNIYEVVLENSFREKVAQFYNEFKQRKNQKRFPTAIGVETVSNLTLLMKYLSGRLPVTDFELDFDKKGTALNMLDSLFECLSEAINSMSRPVDAIKHQAKTVTVGTSRISETVEGILFDELAQHNFNLTHLINSNIIVLKNLQGIISKVQGYILYRIDGLSLLGEITDQTTIAIEKKEGSLKPLSSRVENDATLKGTKRIIVRQGNVYIGKGRKDDRNIVVVPIISDTPSAPSIIKHLLLLHIDFKSDVTLDVKIRALGGKFEHIKNIVQENSIIWHDDYLELVEMSMLFGISAEKIGEFIVSRVNGYA